MKRQACRAEKTREHRPAREFKNVCWTVFLEKRFSIRNGTDTMNTELIAQAAAGVLSLLNDPGLQVAGVGLNVALGAWQSKNLERLEGKLKYELSYLDQRKLDRAFVYSDAFKEFVLQAVSDASETASEVKQEAFARLIANTALGSFEKFKDKHLLRRLLDQISESEIHVLTQLEKLNRAEGKIMMAMAQHEIARMLHWTAEDAQVGLEGLRQLGLAYPRSNGTWSPENRQGHFWDLQDVAHRLIQAVQSPKPESFSESS
jgi:hypothetical protein